MLCEKRWPNPFKKSEPQGVRHFFFQPKAELNPLPDHPQQVKDRARGMGDDFDHLEARHSEQLLERPQAEEPNVRSRKRIVYPVNRRVSDSGTEQGLHAISEIAKIRHARHQTAARL